MQTTATMEVKSVGTFPVMLLKLATPPLPPQTKLNLEQNGWKWVLFFGHNIARGKWGDDGKNPKPNKKLSLGEGSYVTIAWKGFSHSPNSFVLHCSSHGGRPRIAAKRL